MITLFLLPGDLICNAFGCPNASWFISLDDAREKCEI